MIVICQLSAVCLTWNFIITQNRRLPSSGDEDVRSCILLSIDLDSRFRVAGKPGMTLNSLDFCLKWRRMWQNKWKKSLEDAHCILTYIKLDWCKYKNFNMNLLYQDCCDKFDLGDQCKRPFWPWVFCKQRTRSQIRDVCVCVCVCVWYFNPNLLKECKSSQLQSNNGHSWDTYGWRDKKATEKKKVKKWFSARWNRSEHDAGHFPTRKRTQ